MQTRVLVLGAGFGGLEPCALLSEAFGKDIDVTLIDKNDSFVFGYSRLDVMFGRKPLDAVRLPYQRFMTLGVYPVGEIANTGAFQEPSATLTVEKEHLGTSRRTRWFGL